MPRMYDPSLDANRDVTQADFDRFHGRAVRLAVKIYKCQEVVAKARVAVPEISESQLALLLFDEFFTQFPPFREQFVELKDECENPG